MSLLRYHRLLADDRKIASSNAKKLSRASNGSVSLIYPRGGKGSFPYESRALILPSIP